MATQNQMEANRRNALRSTGPRSPEGKAAVRLNAHQCLRGSTVLRDRFRQICAWLKAQGAATQAEQQLIDEMAVAQWNLRQVQICEALLFPSKEDVDDQFGLLDRIWMFETRFENSFNEAYRKLEQMLRARQFPQDRAS
jgi:hypothetical protein